MNSPPFSLRIFGAPSLAGENGALLSGRAVQRHRLALLAILALAPGQALTRDKLLAYLWPERDTEHARQLLNQAVYHLRRALGEEALLSAGEELRINPELIAADIAEFEAALVRDDPSRAVALYRGPLLDGFFLSDAPEFERRAERERERLAGAYAKALETLADAAEEKGDYPSAAQWWRVRATHDPYDSRVALRLMQALAASGNSAAALVHAAVHRRLLEDDLGMDLHPEVQALSERLRRQPVAEDPAPSQWADVATKRENTPPAISAEGAEISAPIGSLPDFSTEQRWAPPAVGYGMTSRGKWVRAAALLGSVALAGTAWAVWPDGSDPERSIVVLPFVNMSSDEENEYFSDGLTEEIITRLSAVSELKVISRTSAMGYKGSQKSLRQIANELSVAHVLSGSVRRSDGRVRVSAQLIDARADEQRWAQNYDHAIQDVFLVQEEIALEVVRALEVELEEGERSVLANQGTRDPKAYELYQRARSLWSTRTKEGHERAIQYYGQAIERDSSYADAYAGLAGAYLTAYQFNLTSAPEAEVYSRIQWAAERALALDDQSASAHASFAIALWWQRNWPGAERELRRAIELNPGMGRGWYALLLSGQGRLEEALRESRRSFELDPFVPVVLAAYGWHCYLTRDHDCAIQQYEKAIELNPSFAQAHQRLGLAYSQESRIEDALRAFRKAAELNPVFLADLAYGLALIGERQEALETLERAKEEPFEAFYVGRAYIALSEPDSAFAWLERSSWQWSHRANRFDPTLDPLRSDPRFAQLSERVERDMGIR